MSERLNLELPNINFDSSLVELIMQLEVMRKIIAPLEINIFQCYKLQIIIPMRANNNGVNMCCKVYIMKCPK